MVIGWWRQRYASEGESRTTTVGQPILLSYLQLIETALAITLRNDGFSFGEIAAAHRHWQQQLRTNTPFVNARLRDLRSLAVRDLPFTTVEPTDTNYPEATNRNWQAAVTQRLAQFDYEDGIVRRWYPRGRDGILVVDPQLAFGAPLIAGTAIPLHIVEERAVAGETDAEIAEDFGIETRQVIAALALHQQKKRHVA